MLWTGSLSWCCWVTVYHGLCRLCIYSPGLIIKSHESFSLLPCGLGWILRCHMYIKSAFWYIFTCKWHSGVLSVKWKFVSRKICLLYICGDMLTNGCEVIWRAVREQVWKHPNPLVTDGKSDASRHRRTAPEFTWKCAEFDWQISQVS